MTFNGRTQTLTSLAGQVQDKGGNIVTTDSTSRILVEFSTSPPGAQLLPPEKTFMPVFRGAVNFTLLKIDRTGQEYRLAFRLYNYDERTQRFVRSSVYTYSDYFDVQRGEAVALTVNPDFANSWMWAGGQPFQTPPTVRLVVSCIRPSRS